MGATVREARMMEQTGAVGLTSKATAGMSKDRDCMPSMHLLPIFACVLAGKIAHGQLFHT